MKHYIYKRNGKTRIRLGMPLCTNVVQQSPDRETKLE